ncbi:MAG: LysR family transcriptional regulator [Aquisalimonadaceae bacterium]
MDIYLNLKAFQKTVDVGSFSGAARELGIAASVVTKRVSQLEHQLGETLFRRSTRSLALTESGRKYLQQAGLVTAQIDELLAISRQPKELEDFLRVKAPTTLCTHYLNTVFQDFIAEFPKVRLELILADQAVDPGAGFDVAINGIATAFSGSQDIPLCRLHRVLCASPDYLARRGVPRHPRDLIRHDCLNFQPTGSNWVFENKRGPVTIAVSPALSSNYGQALADAAVRGHGITNAPYYTCKDALRCGRLLPVLEDFPLPEMWIKAVVAERRSNAPAVRVLLERLKAALAPVPPWEREE